jgi:putative ABC transport system permease protein
MSSLIEPWVRDLRYGARSLARTPGFSLLAIVSLGLGIMATTAIYSVLHAVVLDPFPYRDVGSLMSVRVSAPESRGGRTYYSLDQFVEIAERSTIFDGVIASTISDVLWNGQGEPQRLRGNYGTFNTFDVMGVPPLVGRTPDAADARPGAPAVAVLGYRFWQRQFAGDPGVLGRQLRLDGTMRTVIGVMPKRFMWRGADVYLPVRFQRGQPVADVQTVHLLGRLSAGVTAAQAEADLRPIVADLKLREPDQFPDVWRVGLLPFTETFPSDIQGDIWVLFGAVSLLLLIACANVSNLFLSRAATRQREIAVRVALGASRARLVRQLLTESLLLALVAGVVGTALAYLGMPALLSLVPPGTIPDEAEITLNLPVLAFSLGVSAVTSLLCGLAPALHGRRGDVAVSRREAARGVAGGARPARLRSAFVVLEVALALVLLVGCSLLARAVIALHEVPLGVAPSQVLTLRVPLSLRVYGDPARRVAFFESLVERVDALPGVAAAGVNTGLHPLGNLRAPVEVAGLPPQPEPAVIHQVSDGYFAAVGLRLTSGRLPGESDVRAGRHVAVVNERFVRARLEGRPALGAVVHVPRLKQPPVSLEDDGFQIVGVVADAPNLGLSEPVAPELAIPFTTAAMANRLVVRADGDAAALTRAVIGQVYAIDPDQPVDNVRTLDDLLAEEEYATPRFSLVLFLAFGAIGLLLAVVGVYGVMSAAVSQQRHEIGVRVALGAQRGQILRMIIARGGRLLLVGIALGLAASLFAARAVASRVWNVPPFDPIAFGAVALLLVLVGLQACFWPARRASRIDPLIAMRSE